MPDVSPRPADRGHLRRLIQDRLSEPGESVRGLVERSDDRLSRSYLHGIAREGLRAFPDEEQIEGLSMALRVPRSRIVSMALMDWLGTTMLDSADPSEPPVTVPVADLDEEARAAWLRYASDILRRLSDGE
jgi:hypothetical protein